MQRLSAPVLFYFFHSFAVPDFILHTLLYGLSAYPNIFVISLQGYPIRIFGRLPHALQYAACNAGGFGHDFFYVHGQHFVVFHQHFAVYDGGFYITALCGVY